MYTDANLDFGLPTITNSTSATVSPRVLDQQSAKLLFTAGRIKPKLWFRATITADADPSIKVDVVAADDAALTTNPVVLASSGVVATTADGTAIASGETVEQEFEIGNQQVAKRYIGLMVTLGGTNPDLAAGQDAVVVWDAQTNLRGARAAVPA